MDIKKAEKEDLPSILELQKICYYDSAVRYNDFDIQPMKQTLRQLEDEYEHSVILKMQGIAELVGSIRAYEKDGTCYIGKVIVHPESQNRGIGKSLMKSIENYFPNVKRYELFTGHRDEKNLYFYTCLGYTQLREEILNDCLKLVYLGKQNKR